MEVYEVFYSLSQVSTFQAGLLVCSRVDGSYRKRKGGLRHMPAKQNPDTQAKDPAIPYHYRRRNAALPKNSNGPDHGTTET